MSSKFTPNHRFPIPAANWLLEALEGLGLWGRPLEVGRMKTWARRMTGLSDFGGEEFDEPLSLLIEDINRDSDLNLVGQLFHWYFLSGFLRNRLRLVEAWKRDPSILQRDVEAPLIILGLPRTATTRLFNVLAGDPDLRTLSFWEATRPAPTSFGKVLPFNGRRVNGAFMLGALHYMAPHFKAIHELRLDGPEECIHLFGNSLATWIIPVEYNAPGFTNWFLQSDHTKAYADFKAQLQLIQGNGPDTHWLLKSPHHLFGIEALMQTFPDARIIQTHRDPVKVVPSCCSLAQTTRGIASKSLDAHALGADICNQLAVGLQRTVDFRPHIPPEQIIDIHFQDIVKDIEGTVARIHEKFDISPSDEAMAGIERAIGEDTHNRFGKHSYTAEQFGLAPDMIEERFAHYNETFDVQRES